MRPAVKIGRRAMSALVIPAAETRMSWSIRSGNWMATSAAT
jgi:hypothetical protein